MALSQKRKLKNKLRKQAKRKLSLKKRNRNNLKFNELHHSALVYGKAKLQSCFVAKRLWDVGIGPVTIARELPNKKIAMVSFLVDIYCLGVRDCFLVLLTLNEYKKYIDHHQSNSRLRLKKAKLDYARNLLFSVVRYAKQFEIEPHEDFFELIPFLGEGTKKDKKYKFEFGKDGMPVYIPLEDDPKIDKNIILGKLEKYAGNGNYGYIFKI